MQINKHILFGEVLYRLSVYERGRCNPTKTKWEKKYVAELNNTVNFMEQIVKSLSNEDVTSDDYEIIQNLNIKSIKCSNDFSLNQWEKNNYSLSSINNLAPYREANQLMNNIVKQLKKV